jgi:hypothetical protein
VKEKKVVDRGPRISDCLCEGVSRLHGESRSKQGIVECDVADSNGARRGVLDSLAKPEIFKEIARTRFCGG